MEGYLDGSRSLRRLQVSEFPFRIGRQEGLSLFLPRSEISRVHAEIDREGERLVIRDLGSTNGTFVNHEPVKDETELKDGDIVHLATVELRLVSIEAAVFDTQTTRHSASPLSENLPLGSRHLQEMLLHEQVTAVFQPIFTSEGTVHGWEALGRGAHPKLSEKPMDLFRIAESNGMEVMLSGVFRRKSLELAEKHFPEGRYFINTHPQETEQSEQFVAALAELRERHPDLKLVVELHEAAFADVKALNALRKQLADLDMKLAFDDFGAGRSRLIELSDAPPDYIKLDISVVRNIDRASTGRREMVEMVVEFARKRDIQVIAEGVSRKGENEACRALGVELFQGFFLARPHPPEDLSPEAGD